MTLLADVAATSHGVADTPGRNAKVADLRGISARARPRKIAIGVAYLSGDTRQGRSGIGYALLRDAQPDAARTRRR